ncbi:hypothetical protein ACKKBF_B40455 [Auxenochlorella protothecoides x Auxenochlorella symbiontica]
MASHRRTPILFLTLLVLSLGVLSKGACTSKVFSLPAVTYKTHVYMLEFNSADAFCESQGYSKAGSVRNTTLDALDLPVSAVQMRPFKVLEARSTDIIVSVECLKTGQTACAADKGGNTGAGKQGKNRFEDSHVGDWTIGNFIEGTLNCEYDDRASSVRCSNAPGTGKGLNMRSLKELHQAVGQDYQQALPSVQPSASSPAPKKAPPPLSPKEGCAKRVITRVSAYKMASQQRFASQQFQQPYIILSTNSPATPSTFTAALLSRIT